MKSPRESKQRRKIAGGRQNSGEAPALEADRRE